MERWSPPPTFDEYVLVQRIGQGGMGEVYLARDTLLERPVAIKFMSRSLDIVARERFLVEARAAARLQHPNVVTVYRIGELAGHPYIVSELVRGTCLAMLPRPMSWRDALALGRDLARGLAAAHRRGVLHRDIKPANAIRAETGEVKLLDFGLAKLVASAELPVADTPADRPVRPWPPGDRGAGGRAAPTLSMEGSSWSDSAGAQADAAALTREGAVMGTPYYMSPEAWRGEVATARSDVYSLGVLLYELCTGWPPHGRVPPDELREAVCTRDLPSIRDAVADIDPRFAAVIDRCLTRSPGARYATAGELGGALDDIALIARPRRHGARACCAIAAPCPWCPVRADRAL